MARPAGPSRPTEHLEQHPVPTDASTAAPAPAPATATATASTPAAEEPPPTIDGASSPPRPSTNHPAEPQPLQPQPSDDPQIHSSNGPPKPPHSSSADLKQMISAKKQHLKDKQHPPGGFDRTPLPPAPPGWTLRFVFHRAANLPPADFSTVASDPFIHATLRAPGLPKRHREDPDLTHRTPTLRRTLEPEWNDPWIVANVPASGFSLKCRMYDEDYPDRNDRLGNATIRIAAVDADLGGQAAAWKPPGRELVVQKRVGSKRAYAIQGCLVLFGRHAEMTPSLWVSIEVLGPSPPPHAHMYTVGPSFWIKHYSPMIGRITGTMVNKDESDDVQDDGQGKPKTQKYDFQANEMQLSGPVPPELYHRYVAFRPVISSMFSRKGLAGRLLNKALHKQHERVYNFDQSTERAIFDSRSRDGSLRFLRLAHFDEGGRIFTYVLTLDGMFRFCETGHEFGIDLLSKHTMHSNVETYIACSGEFFVRRLARPDASDSPHPQEHTHPPDTHLSGGPPRGPPPPDPSFYQLIIDNDSGSYRPDKSILPLLKAFLEANFPGLGVVALHWEDEHLKEMKREQLRVKKKEGPRVHMVPNSSPSSSSMSSNEGELEDMERLGIVGGDDDEEAGGAGGSGPGRKRATTARRKKAKVERAVEALEHPKRAVDLLLGDGRVKETIDEGAQSVKDGAGAG